MFATLAQAETPRFSNEWWLTVGVSLGLILLFAVIVNVIARRYVRRLEDRAAMLAEGTEREKLRQARRRATVAKLLLDTFQIVVWSVVVMIILTSLGVNLGPLLATAGIAGVALGFGAQTIVRDTLSGFFILAENQFDVGDTVDLQTSAQPVSGTVEALTLRITMVRAFDGTLNIVPNGNILVTSNKTRGWGRAIVDLRLPYDQDVDQVREILNELFDEIRSRPAVRGCVARGTRRAGDRPADRRRGDPSRRRRDDPLEAVGDRAPPPRADDEPTDAAWSGCSADPGDRAAPDRELKEGPS